MFYIGAKKSITILTLLGTKIHHLEKRECIDSKVLAGWDMLVQGSSNYQFFWGSNFMQIYGQFEGPISLNNVLFGLVIHHDPYSSQERLVFFFPLSHWAGDPKYQHQGMMRPCARSRWGRGLEQAKHASPLVAKNWNQQNIPDIFTGYILYIYVNIYII